MPSSSGLPGRPHTSSRLARSPERAAALARIEVICGRRSLPRPGRSAGSLSSGIPDGLVGHEGRLHDDKDVPIRLAVVLSRSNRVLTLRRIVHEQPQISAVQADGSRRVEGSCIPFSLPHLLRTRVGVVSVVRLLTSPTGCATVAGTDSNGECATVRRRRRGAPHRKHATSPRSCPSREGCRCFKTPVREPGADAYRVDLDCPCGNRARPDPARCHCRRYPPGTA